MSLSYDGKKIIPSPLLSFTKEYIKTDDGTKLGSLYKLTLTGTLLPFKGSPDSTFTLDNPVDAFWTLGGYPSDEPYVANNTDFANLQRKQEALRWLFSTEGMSLEWQAAGGQEVVKCNPRIISISFGEGQWADRCDYTIELEADNVLVTRGSSDSEDTFDYNLIQGASEDWQFDEVEGRIGQVYSVSHTVNAKGIQGYELNGQSLGFPWDKARLWCESKIAGSIPSGIMDTVVGAINWVGGSYVKGIGIGQADGTYSITETWSMGDTNTFIEKSFSLNRKYEDDESVEVSYRGTIYGLSDGERIGGPDAISQAKLLVPSIAVAKAETETALEGTEFLDTNLLSKIPKQRNTVINNNNGTVSFTFLWSTDEEDDYSLDNEATLSHSTGDGSYVMSLTMNISGKGSTPEIRLINANTGLPPTEAAAHAIASGLLSDQITNLPVGTIISTDSINQSTAVNEKHGTINATWSWNNSATNNITIQVENSYPRYITAQIPIPGRTAGPIIQRMNTKTAQRITVTYSGGGMSVKPDEDTVAGIMDVAGGIPPALGEELFLPGSYVLESDTETWNDTTKQYNRVRTHTVTED